MGWRAITSAEQLKHWNGLVESVRERESEIEDISQIDREMVMDNEDSTHTGPVLLFLLSDENLRLYSHSISDTDSHTKNYVPHPSLNISCSLCMHYLHRFLYEQLFNCFRKNVVNSYTRTGQ